MKHIVFVFGYYYPEAMSTSLCTINVINTLKAREDVKITCICGTRGEQRTDTYDGMEVHRVQTDPWKANYLAAGRVTRMWMVMKKVVKDAFHVLDYPDMDKPYSRRLYEELELVHSRTPIDGIVSSYMPFQSVSAAILFKEKHPETRIVGYFLDTLRGSKPLFITRGMHRRMCDKAEHAHFAKLDKVILMQYAKSMFDSKVFDDVRDRMTFLSLPSLKIEQPKPREKNEYRCCFIGTTYREIRNPMYAMKVFAMVSKDMREVSLHLYGKTDMQRELDDWEIAHPGFFAFHGFIGSDEVDGIYDETDYVVSIGNKLKGIVPGKTFEIFGKLKPIIHFTDVENDSSLEYIEKYPNVCILDMRDSIETSALKMMEFLKKPYEICDADFMRQTYASALPDATVGVIMDTIK